MPHGNGGPKRDQRVEYHTEHRPTPRTRLLPDSGDSHQTGRVQQHKHQQSQGGGGRPAPVVADLLRQRRGIFGIDVAEGIGRAERGDDDFLRRETATNAMSVRQSNPAGRVNGSSAMPRRPANEC